MTLQEKYWEDMTQLKFKVYYFESYFHETSLIDKCLSGFLSITASAGIGGWVIWEELKFVWAIVIAVAQILNVIKGQLPYTVRKKTLLELQNKLSIIFDVYDNNWYKVSKAQISEAELNELVSSMRSKITAISNELIIDSLPYAQRHYTTAQKRVSEYYSVYGS